MQTMTRPDRVVREGQDPWQRVMPYRFVARLIDFTLEAVMAETTEWFEDHAGIISESGFDVADRILWRRGCWWSRSIRRRRRSRRRRRLHPSGS